MHEITEIDGNKIATLPLTISAFLRNMHLHYSYLVSDSSIPEKIFKDLKYIMINHKKSHDPFRES